ncbi:chaperonin 10-like protein [Penicillium malachiteum]|nr:chaperonin 10-like protein [Penicillium malachiteum]
MSGTQKAVIITAPKTAELVTNQSRPSLLDDYILVKTEAVALNPTDWKFVANNSVSGCLVGCDYAGVIEEVGKDVKKDFQKGDRVCGFAHGGHILRPQVGAFAEYIIAKGDVQMQIPDNLSFEEAATLGIGIATVGQGLYQSLKLALPTSPLTTPEPLLIYGGSTATGTLAIQYAKLSGYKVLTTCSPHNFELVKNLGADEIARENINSRATLGYTIMGEDFMIGPMRVPARPDDFAFAQDWLLQAFKFLASGQVKVHPLKVNPDGLKGVPEGLNLMKEGKVSGEKLVYKVSETP